MTERFTKDQLLARIRANCCPISGLSDKQLQAHARHIANTVRKAREPKAKSA